MKFFSDLHLHSKYSRACSRNLDLENLIYFAKLKGINLLATGDITHPLWFKEIFSKLEEADEGIYKLKKSNEQIFFVLGGEISSIFSRNNKVYRIHYIVILPNFNLVEKLNKKLALYSNLASDGRPNIGLDVIDFMKILFDIYDKAIFIPAHIWTPWYSLYGSMSGFNSIFDAFANFTKYVTAVETGLSSDPNMNWRLSELDNFSIVSFSDAHSPSPHRLGREITVFELDQLSYDNLYRAMKKPDDQNKIALTVEFFPEEGKYHYDGHRLCNIRFSPSESKQNNYLCPECKRKLTIGVMSRVEELADRPDNFLDPKRPQFIKTTPLLEIIAQIVNANVGSKKVFDLYCKVIEEIGTEINILLGYHDEEKMKNKYPEINLALSKIKKGDIILEAGYDGVYGKVIINTNLASKKTLF